MIRKEHYLSSAYFIFDLKLRKLLWRPTPGYANRLYLWKGRAEEQLNKFSYCGIALNRSTNGKWPTYLNFVDLEKAFYFNHCERPWIIMKKYCIPEKMVRMTQTFYEFSSVLYWEDQEGTSDWLDVRTGVKQRCNMSEFSSPPQGHNL